MGRARCSGEVIDSHGVAPTVECESNLSVAAVAVL